MAGVYGDLKAFLDFDVTAAEATLWVFKKRTVKGDVNPFRAFSVLLGDKLREQMKQVASGFQGKYTSATAYDILSNPDDGEFLAIGVGDTIFQDLKLLIDQPHEENLAKAERDLMNSAGYVLRLLHDDRHMYCVKKASSDWKAAAKRSFFRMTFKNSKLDLVIEPSFSISNSFDFFVVNDHLFMADKKAFESLLSHKDSYEDNYVQLKADPDFAATISDMAPIDAYVGNNAMHLKRMTVIKMREYYKRPGYLEKLREVSDYRGWGIQFDDKGRVVPTEEKVRDILHILLDHRLRSELSDNQYDVPSVTPISG